MEEQAIEPPRRSCGTQLIFILYGVASLLGWNALLTKLDFFFIFFKRDESECKFFFSEFYIKYIISFFAHNKRKFIFSKISINRWYNRFHIFF